MSKKWINSKPDSINIEVFVKFSTQHYKLLTIGNVCKLMVIRWQLHYYV